MTRAHLSPFLCGFTRTSQLKPWRWLVYIDSPEAHTADRPARTQAAPTWVVDGAGWAGSWLYEPHSRRSLAEFSPCGMNASMGH